MSDSVTTTAEDYSRDDELWGHPKGLYVCFTTELWERFSFYGMKYLLVLNETLGEAWMTPNWFRFGASSLLNDVLMQIRFQETGRYSSPDYFTKD